ncbi:metallopeptidase family protein [Maritimibacter alexandrii]|uniref:metallopeptidase family protein n=1 Tax=Maritimibacter alexandrii TaxID=2570355 RepID=UPI00110981AA|nr:metallopeptidase family protein [Maritimibacter alexandrii]
MTDGLPPTLEEIETIAHDTVEALPEAFRGPARTVAIRVEDFPSDDMLASLDIDSPFELTGLYEGIPLTEKSVFDQPGGPDVIWLFRRPILDEWADRGDVEIGALVAHIMVHELAHHFGWSDDDIASIDRWWE